MQFVLELVHGLAKRTGVSAIELGGKHPQTFDVERARQQVIALAGRKLRFQARELAVGHPRGLKQMFDLAAQFGHRGLEGSGRLRKRRLDALRPAERARAGHRLDASDAGCDTAFRDDLEQTDIAGAAHMGAATQLAA